MPLLLFFFFFVSHELYPHHIGYEIILTCKTEPIAGPKKFEPGGFECGIYR